MKKLLKADWNQYFYLDFYFLEIRLILTLESDLVVDFKVSQSTVIWGFISCRSPRFLHLVCEWVHEKFQDKSCTKVFILFSTKNESTEKLILVQYWHGNVWESLVGSENSLFDSHWKIGKSWKMKKIVCEINKCLIMFFQETITNLTPCWKPKGWLREFWVH